MADGDVPEVTTQQVVVPPDASASVASAAAVKIKPPVRDTTRKQQDDLTGFYEADPPADVWNSNRLLQLNQAGRVLVGWMTTPPRFVDSLQDFAVRHAVLIVDLSTPKVSKGIQFYYKEVSQIEGSDPSALLPPDDPWDLTDQPPEGVLLGYLGYTRIAEPESPGWNRSSPRWGLSVTFCLKGGSEASLTFYQTSNGARVAERTIGCQEEPLKTVLMARHRRPIPTTFFATSRRSASKWAALRKLFNGDANGKLGSLIGQYMTNLGGPSVPRLVAREAITNVLDEAFSWMQTEPYERLLRLRMTAEVAQSELTLPDVPENPPSRGPSGSKGSTRTYRDWLSAIAVNEVASHMDEKHGEDFKAYPRIFDLFSAGIKIYRYDLEFATLAKTIGAYLRGGGGGFALTVNKYWCELPEHGRLPQDSDWTGEDAATYYGLLFEMKIGLGDPPDLPEKASIYTGEDIKPQELHGAVFEMYALDASVSGFLGGKTPVFKVGLKLTSGGSAGVIRLHLKDRPTLEAPYATGGLKPELEYEHSGAFETESLKKIFSTRGTAEDSDFMSFKPECPEVGLGASAAIGYIGYEKTFPNWIRSDPKAKAKMLKGGDGRTLTAGFEVNSATLNKKANGWDVRFLLETVLATDLALFNGVPTVDVLGSASPEYTPSYNLLLSQMRALAVKYAILDALGSVYASVVRVAGAGDSAALVAQLKRTDPTGDPQARARLLKDPAFFREQVSHWAEFRKVDIDLRGNFFIRAVTVEESDDDAAANPDSTE